MIRDLPGTPLDHLGQRGANETQQRPQLVGVASRRRDRYVGGWFDPLNEDVDQSDITTADTEHREAADALLVGRNVRELPRVLAAADGRSDGRVRLSQCG